MNAFEHLTQLKKMLRNLDTWIQDAIELAGERSFDPDVLVTWRLRPDMFTFARQVQSACDTAKFAAARLSGKKAPSDPDDETTLAELRARIDKTVAYLDAQAASDFDGAEERLVALPFVEGKGALGRDYLLEFALPNFHFHLVTAYDILRVAGVPLGKLKYIGSVDLKDL